MVLRKKKRDNLESRLEKPVVVLLPARLVLTRSTYLSTVRSLILYLCFFLTVLLLLLGCIFIIVKIPLDHSPAFLEYLSQNANMLLEGSVETFVLAVLLWFIVRQKFNNLRGHIKIRQQLASGDPSLKLGEYIQGFLYYPDWIEPLPLVDLTDDGLEILQSHGNPDAPWMKQLATFVKDHPIEMYPALSLRLLLEEGVTLSVLGPRGKPFQKRITHKESAGLLGYLAFQKRGEWTIRKQVLKEIYGDHIDHVNTHIKRLNDTLNEATQHVKGQPNKPEDTSSMPDEEKRLKLIEYDGSEKENRWRLTLACNVEVFPELEILYKQMIEAKRDPGRLILDCETLHPACQRMMEQYGDGLFATYHKSPGNSYWP